jgi:hypothetical protein
MISANKTSEILRRHLSCGGKGFQQSVKPLLLLPPTTECVVQLN